MQKTGMKSKRAIAKFLLAAAATAVMAASTVSLAIADDHHGWDRGWDQGDHHDHHDQHDSHWHGGPHDRYWHDGYGGYLPHDRVYVSLRGHGYARWTGEPYWFHDHYVVQSFDRRGRPVFVEINPYTAEFIGEIRF